MFFSTDVIKIEIQNNSNKKTHIMSPFRTEIEVDILSIALRTGNKFVLLKKMIISL